MKNCLLLATLIIITCQIPLTAQVEIDKSISLTGNDGERNITNLELPVNGTDAVNKDYVDGLVSGGGGHSVGDLYQGGIIVAVWKEGIDQFGLIASLEDIPTSGGSYTMAWSGATSSLIGPSAQSPSYGASNTAAIVSQNSTPDKAATVCDAYVNPDTGTGVYSDWYLPAIWELNMCFAAAGVVNSILGDSNGFQLAPYLSSTEFNDSSGTLQQYFAYGNSYYAAKSDTGRVRAVRRF